MADKNIANAPNSATRTQPIAPNKIKSPSPNTSFCKILPTNKRKNAANPIKQKAAMPAFKTESQKKAKHSTKKHAKKFKRSGIAKNSTSITLNA